VNSDVSLASCIKAHDGPHGESWLDKHSFDKQVPAKPLKMGLLQIVTAAVAVFGAASAAPAGPAAQTCDATGVCWSETSAGGIVYRVAIPVATAAPFDVLLQIVAPKATGWAGIAWGGVMTGNPLTLGWVNGTNTVASSRWATYVNPFSRP
jgi:hypothetical protein